LVRKRFPALRPSEYLVVTAHRRESFGAPMRRIAEAVAVIAHRYPHLEFVIPLHPNPNASSPFRQRLEGCRNVVLTAPLPYQLMIGLIANARAILTDSGGLQEEAPSFGVRVLVLREVTERPEGIAAGSSILVGTDQDRIVDVAVSLLEIGAYEGNRSFVANPYGDGHSSERIVKALLEAAG